MWDETATEVLLAGPAGTGKSRACLEKVYYQAETVPGLRVLIVRQVRASLTETGLATWETLVIPPRHPSLGTASRQHRLSYVFANGSQVNAGGLDHPDKIMSSEYDLIYVQEATELKPEGWEALLTRLRNGRLHYQQLLADCNPGPPTHWLKRRCDAGACRMLHSRHEDNPRLHDGQTWTPFGLKYLRVLDSLTGARKERLRHGRWVQAEGVVYEGWDAGLHIIDRFAVPKDWPRYLAVDFGFTNPFVCQWWAEDPDGRLYLYRELYRTKRLVEDHAKDILDHIRADGVRPVAVVCDHDAEDRATLSKHLGLGTTPALKAVTVGLQAVATRLVRMDDGKPRLYFFRDAVVSRDAELDSARRPCSTIEEFDGYIWNVRDGRPPKEEPVKDNDHGMDAARYMVMHRDNRREVKIW